MTFAAILLYRLTLESGQFEVIKDSMSRLTTDRRIQVLLIAFAFGAFIEGAAGSGVPVAVGAAMLTGLGFDPLQAAGLCLLANTAPVAFAAIGTPTITLAVTTGLPLSQLSAATGRLCAPLSICIPAYLTVLVGGWRGLRGAWPAVVACGVTFASVQLLVSNLLGPQMTDILASLATMACLALLLRKWQPRDGSGSHDREPNHQAVYGAAAVWRAWMPYVLLAVCVLAWGLPPVRALLVKASIPFAWPGLHRQILRTAPVVAAPEPYAAIYNLDWLATAGTACLFACVLSAAFAGLSFRKFGGVFQRTAQQMFLPLVTIASVLGLAFVMNYSGATATLGLAFAGTGALFPFFSPLPSGGGRFPHGFRHLRQCVVWGLAGCDCGAPGLESRSDGRSQFQRGRDGQDDQRPEHRGGGRCHGDEELPGSRPVSLYLPAQRGAGLRHGWADVILCLRHAALDSLNRRKFDTRQAVN